MIRLGDVVWVDFGTGRGSEPAKVRPALIVQANWLLDTDIATVLVIPMTSNTDLKVFPGNVFVAAEVSGLDRDSVVLVTQTVSIDRRFIEPYPVGHVPAYVLSAVSSGLRLVSGL